MCSRYRGGTRGGVCADSWRHLARRVLVVAVVWVAERVLAFGVARCTSGEVSVRAARPRACLWRLGRVAGAGALQPGVQQPAALRVHTGAHARNTDGRARTRRRGRQHARARPQPHTHTARNTEERVASANTGVGTAHAHVPSTKNSTVELPRRAFLNHYSTSVQGACSGSCQPPHGSRSNTSLLYVYC